MSSLSPAVKAVDGALSKLEGSVRVAASRGPGYLELAARDLAYSLARIYTGRYHSHTLKSTPKYKKHPQKNKINAAEPAGFFWVLEILENI